MLGFHTDVYAGPEFDHLPGLMRLYRQMVQGIASRQSVYYTRDDIRQYFSTFVSCLLLPTADRLGKRLVSEKTPNNVHVFDDLADVFGDAKFVFVVRDPRAVLYSMRQVGSRATAAGSVVHVGGDALLDLDAIDGSVSAGDRFATSNPERCYVVHYESLVSEPDAVTRDLCRFLGIGFQPTMLETERKNEDVQAVLDKSGYVWYTPEMYNSAIDPARSAAWQRGLDHTLAVLAEDYFAQKRYACYERYALKLAARPQRLRYLVAIARHRCRASVSATRTAFRGRLGQLSRAWRLLRL
jgi:hypothetical protein